MGLFDSVYVDCPHCGSKVELQCTGQECMNSYTLENAPTFILREIMNGEPSHCMKCDGWLAVVDPRNPYIEERPPAVVAKVRSPPNPSVHEQGMKWWPGDVSYGPEDLIK